MSTAPKAATDALERMAKFMRNEPLTEELRAVRDGTASREDAGENIAEARAIEGLLAAPGRRELLAVRDMLQEPGWAALDRLAQRYLQERFGYVIRLSQSDPLAQRDEIAAAWADLNSKRRAWADIRRLAQEAAAEGQRREGEAGGATEGNGGETAA